MYDDMCHLRKTKRIYAVRVVVFILVQPGDQKSSVPLESQCEKAQQGLKSSLFSTIVTSLNEKSNQTEGYGITFSCTIYGKHVGFNERYVVGI